MGLIIGYETIKSRAFYHINFKIEGKEFIMISGDKGMEDPNKALGVVRALQSKGITPEVSRTIVFNKTRSGYMPREEPRSEDLTIERLEQIASTEEALPECEEPIILSAYRT